MIVAGITPTGGRPEALALCHRWMERQTRPLDEWVVVDDGGVTDENTQAANLLAAIDQVTATADVVLVIEDDDWYSPRYVEHMIDLAERSELFGDGRARYYNVATSRWAQLHNTAHASLCQTGWRASLTPLVRDVLATGPAWIDIELWKRAAGRGRVNEPGVVRCVGVKGLPGRPGIGVGHRADFGTPDRDREMLRQWVGLEDAEVYAELTGVQP